MPLGNNRYEDGTKKSNWKYEYASLTQLTNISAAVAAGATEATLLMVLAALQSQQEFEQNLVMDLGGAGCPGNCPTYLQVRIWNEVTHTFNPPIYYNASGAVVIPVGPVEIVNPQYVLQDIELILANIDNIVTLALDVPLSTLSTTLTSIETLLTPTPLSAFRDVAVTNAAVAVKGTAGDVWGWNIINTNPSPVYLKIYDAVAAGVGVGITIPVMTLMVPSNGSVFQNPSEAQLINATAIAIACVTGVSDADATAPAAAVHVEIKYK